MDILHAYFQVITHVYVLLSKVNIQCCDESDTSFNHMKAIITVANGNRIKYKYGS